MSEYERSEQQWNRALLALAVRRIAYDYSGYGSKARQKAYQAERILAKLAFRANGSKPEEWSDVRSIAAAYLWKHRREIVATW